MARSRNTRKQPAKLSERQQKILDFIEAFLGENGYPPTIREIGKAVNIGSTSVVNYNLNKLVREGFLSRSQKVSRGLLLVPQEHETDEDPRSPVRKAVDNLLRIQLAGQIVASKPVEFFGIHYDDDSLVEVPASLLGKVSPDQLYALRVSGNSMIDAMVSDGDIVIMRHQYTAENGDMVAVWLNDTNETTLKYFYREAANRIRLQPANPLMEAIYVDARRVEIQGRVVAVMRVV